MRTNFFPVQLSRSLILKTAINIFIILVIYFTALLGSKLGIKSLPLQISVVWPATGFSLAAILLFGYGVWPAIFLGNFVYNFHTIFIHIHTIPGPLIVAALVAFGSLLQALIAGYIIKNYSSQKCFSSFHDIIIFLLPAGLLTCMFSSTIGTTSLYVFDGMIDEHYLYTWMTFWLGDLLGIYIFTPLIYVWVEQKLRSDYIKHLWEIPLMAASFGLIWWSTFVWEYPLYHLFLPLCIWVIYRFDMHGATFAVFITCLAIVIPISQGSSLFFTIPQGDPLLILVSILAVIIATSLITSAILAERNQAAFIIKKQNSDLKEEIKIRLLEVSKMCQDIFAKDKHATMGRIYFEVAKKILNPLKKVAELSDNSLKHSDKISLMKTSNFEKDNLFNEVAKLQKNLTKIIQTKNQVERLTNLLEQQMENTQREVKVVNLHTLLNQCLEKAFEDLKERFPTFKFSLEKKYDRNVKSVSALPWELAYALMHLIYRSLYSMKEKWNRLNGDCNFALQVETQCHPDKFEIILKDNGMGISKLDLDKYFRSFFDPVEALDIKIIELSLAYDIIVKVHQGDIVVDSEEGSYTVFRLYLPIYRT